ncbi:MAG TPA: AMP-binding protein [Candidatus Methylomirabilis sp.]|nr:AMP-binding protein [Candidatus Methylomirabilis sp.]
MSAPGYFDEARHRQILDEYPLGPAFRAGVARVSRDALRALQDRRFRAVLKRAWEVPFYRRRWGARGIEPGDIRDLEDIEKLPPFSKIDLVQSVAEHPPFGDYHGVDLAADERLSVVLHTTSGTTGAPQPVVFGAWDREVQNSLLARAYLLQGLRADDVVHSVYGFGMVNGGHYVREALVHFTKAIVLPAGTGLETRSEQQVELMRTFGATVIVGFVDYVKRLAQVAREHGIEPGRDIKIRMISGHVGHEDRSAISAAWGGADVYDWYGVADTGIIAAEGPEHDGLHVWEDAHYVEIVDPDTHAARPAGESGNLCVTALFKDGVYPIVRFDTCDVSSFITRSPEHGLAFRRISGFQGRSDQMIKLRGINVYPTAIGIHLGSHPALTGEFVCRAERHGARDELTVIVEARPGADRPELGKELRALLRQKLGVEVGVELVAPGATAPLTGIDARQKPIRLIDRRRT